MSGIGHRLAELRAHAERAAHEAAACDVSSPEARRRLIETLDVLVLVAVDAVDALEAPAESPPPTWRQVTG